MCASFDELLTFRKREKTLAKNAPVMEAVVAELQGPILLVAVRIVPFLSIICLLAV